MSLLKTTIFIFISAVLTLYSCNEKSNPETKTDISKPKEHALPVVDSTDFSHIVKAVIEVIENK